MNCDYVRENIDEFLDAAEDSHVAHCTDCLELLSAVRKDRELLRGLQPLAVPDELRLRINEQLRLEIKIRRAKPPAWKFFVPRLAPLAAAIMVMVAGTNIVPGYLATKDMARSVAPDPEAPLMAPPPPGILTEADPVPKETGDVAAPDPAPSPDDPKRGAAEVVEPDDEFIAMAMPEDTSEAEALIAMEGVSRPLWVTAAMGGAVLMLLWSTVVFFWYRRL
ncbi:MAG TPA: hypothetical protein VK905_03160 [Bacillota bacterium]|nr:hypothetical protein [Bacillota bacterium]